MPTPNPRFLEALQRSFTNYTPHIKALGVAVESIAAEASTLRLPFQAHFIGDVARGRLHTGVITTLVDTACGLAALARVGRPAAVATLDLRVDYLRSAYAGQDLFCRACCYRLTSTIAFLRASVWQETDVIIAESMGAFVITELPQRKATA